MAINLGVPGKAKIRPEMNVTPLVDVVLVLLIIFMVITPLMSKQFWVNVPKMAEEKEEDLPPDSVPVVLGIDASGALNINGRPIERESLERRLRRILGVRAEKIIFIDAADDAPFGATVEAMDTARGAGAVTIAVIPEKGQA
jgi:biopolymer transport protein ExbD